MHGVIFIFNLFQMIPPADTIPHVINRIVGHLNLTNAVIFYESDLFYLNSKHKNLLKNTPTRHVFTKLEYKTKHERSKELNNYRNMQDMNNYFLLGSPENISIFLGKIGFGNRMRICSYDQFFFLFRIS
jgi:hypothetical protein